MRWRQQIEQKMVAMPLLAAVPMDRLLGLHTAAVAAAAREPMPMMRVEEQVPRMDPLPPLNSPVGRLQSAVVVVVHPMLERVHHMQVEAAAAVVEEATHQMDWQQEQVVPKHTDWIGSYSEPVPPPLRWHWRVGWSTVALVVEPSFHHHWGVERHFRSYHRSY